MPRTQPNPTTVAGSERSPLSNEQKTELAKLLQKHGFSHEATEEFVGSINGAIVFAFDLHPAIAKNSELRVWHTRVHRALSRLRDVLGPIHPNTTPMTGSEYRLALDAELYRHLRLRKRKLDDNEQKTELTELLQKYGFPHEDTDEFISSINNVIVSAVSAAERYHDYKGEGPLAGLLEHLSKHCMAEIEKLPPTKKETDRWIRLVNKLAELWCRHLGEIPEKKLPVPRQRWERLGETQTPDTAPFKSVLHIVIRGVEACYFRKKEIVTPAKIDRWATDAINKLSDKKK